MLRLERERQPLDLATFKMRAARDEDYQDLITEACTLWDGDVLQAVYVPLAEQSQHAAVLAAWRAALPQIHCDVDHRSWGLPTRSRIIGYRPRVPIRNDFCGPTSLAMEAPGVHAAVVAAASVVAEYYAAYAPGLYTAHLAQTEEHVLPTYRLADTAFTSGIVNRNSPLKYHYDTGNYRGVWSGQLVSRQAVDGGYLVFPEFGVAFACADRSLLLFDGQATLHGVSPLVFRSPFGVRHSVVYYSLREMWNCLEPTAELARIRERRSTMQRRHAGLA